MSDISTNQSVESEPHLQHASFIPDESEEKADRVFAEQKVTLDQAVEHSVWDEPALSGKLSEEPSEEHLTYASWLSGKIKSTTIQKSWAVTFLLVLSSGPWAIIGVFFLSVQGYGGFGAAAVVVFGPVLEELLKISSALITVEKRPYLFTSKRQIFLCCLFSGLIFAFFENLLYLYIYIKDPTPLIVLWRWTACVLLHAGCTYIARIGLIKIWSETTKKLKKPNLPLMTKYVAAACIIHCCYNALALILDPLFK